MNLATLLVQLRAYFFHINTTSTTTTMSYDAAGSVLSIGDPLGHTSSISYADKFSTGGVNLDAPRSFSTFAYPTSVTDADGFSSSVWYNYDFAAKTRTQGPPPQNQSQGIIQTFSYDEAMRLKQVTTVNTGAYVHYDYGPDYTSSFSSVNSVAANYWQSDLYTNSFFDGLGRAVAMASNHPGSSGGNKGQYTHYDQMGRAVQQSNPFEMDSGWNPTGDDSAGYQFNVANTFDWKGRPLKSYNMDGTYKEASYAGCGCAGGEVVTLTDEVGRQQKAYSDVLGRTVKTEVLNWQGGSVYSATVNFYNARDQITLARQYAGAEGSGIYQDTTMTYDGYGRLQAKHVPEQNANTATTYNYNADDTVQSVTDARGASATYSYNGRHLVTGITYYAPSGVSPTSPVSYGYDAVGNRTSMNDGLGSVSYGYSQLSQMTSESRTFTGVGTFTLGYAYNLAGQLNRITDPTNMTINYGFDFAGRLNSVTGSDNLFLGISTYASSFQYRAWNGLKTMADGSNHLSSLAYNSKLQPTQFDISGGIVHQNYDYQNDGRLSFVHSTADAKFDRSYSYDHAGRLTEAKTGGQARGDATASPYYETFGYDAFSNLTARQSNNWTQDTLFDSASYANGRRSGWGYDADGRNTTIGTRTYAFNADGQVASMTGQMWTVNHYVNVSQTMGYDGDGQKVKEGLTGAPTYYLRSTALKGAIIEEIDSSGQKKVGYVYTADGEVLAKQVPLGSSSYVVWKNSTPAGTGQYDWNVGAAYGNGMLERVELDPVGADVGIEAPQTSDLGGGEGDIGANHFGPVVDSRWSNFFDLRGGCSDADGVVASCKSGPTTAASFGLNLLGTHIADLPGFGTNWGSIGELGLWNYGRQLAYTLERTGMIRVSREGMPRGTDPTFEYNAQKPNQNVTDCQAFAAMVEALAGENIGKAEHPDDVRNFMDAMAQKFTEYNSAGSFFREAFARTQAGRAVGERAGGDNNRYLQFGSSGFAPDVFEPDDNGHPSNQVRHSVAGFLAGYTSPTTGTAALNRMNVRENPNDLLHGVPDIHLNSKTVPMAANLGGGKGRILALRLGQWIRQNLCEH